MRDPTTMPATALPDWRKRYDCRPARFSRDKDAPLEPDPKSETDCGAAANGRSRLAKDRRLRLRVSAVGFLAALVLCLVATPFVQGLEEGQLYQAKSGPPFFGPRNAEIKLGFQVLLGLCF